MQATTQTIETSYSHRSVFRGGESRAKLYLKQTKKVRSPEGNQTQGSSGSETVPDRISKDQRSALMSRVRQRHTAPEVRVRSILHRLGFRFRLHPRELPGKPDIVLPKYGAVVLVHGCFWHGHSGCPRSKRPQTNSVFWNEKLDKNRKRDEKTLRELKQLGWMPIVVWECEVARSRKIARRLCRRLDSEKLGLIDGTDL